MIRTVATIAAFAALAACSTTSVGLKYSAPTDVTKVAPATPAVVVGAFVDSRGEPATWLGAIRGGFGNPLKTLESDRPVSELVSTAFADGLKARGVSLEKSAGGLSLAGVVKKLECIQIARREGTVEVEVKVVDGNGKQRFAKTYAANRLDGSIVTLSAGVFGSVEDLRQTLEATLKDVVDKALDDKELRAALQPY